MIYTGSVRCAFNEHCLPDGRARTPTSTPLLSHQRLRVGTDFSSRTLYASNPFFLLTTYTGILLIAFHTMIPEVRYSFSSYSSSQDYRGLIRCLIPSTKPILSPGFTRDLKILLLMNSRRIAPVRTRYPSRIQLPVQRRMRPLIRRQRNDRVLNRPHVVMESTRIAKKARLHIVPVWHFGV